MWCTRFFDASSYCRRSGIRLEMPTETKKTPSVNENAVLRGRRADMSGSAGSL